MTPEPAAACATGVCVTCADEALPMRVIDVDEARALALCEGEDGTRRTVEIGLLDGIARDEELLVHAGVALARSEAA